MTETKRNYPKREYKWEKAGGRAETLRETLNTMYDGGDAGLTKVITDTLTDLRHLCEYEKIDFDRCNAKGQDLYHDERAEDIANGLR